jgi:DNA-binding transcriptional regulator YiaG
MKPTLYRFSDAGLKNVWLLNGYTIKRTRYGDAVAIQDVEGLTRVICKALVRKIGRLNGAEFRYLRLHLRLSQKALAKLLGNTEQSVANWEKRGRVPLWADKHIRILWQAAQEGNETVKRVVARLNDVERLLNQRIVVEETARGWRSRVEDGVAA